MSAPSNMQVARCRHRRLQPLRGFTLLEVLVAVAILGLGLTSILSVQFSAITGTAHARHMSVAMGLLRCKMSELEQHLHVDGFQEIGEEGSGACCEGDDTRNIGCSWVIERPTFPAPHYGQLNLDTSLEGTALGKLADSAESGDAIGSGDLSDLGSSLSGEDMGDLAAGGVGGIAAMVMEMVYPDLKALFEASARRITVTLTWTEGDRSYDITVAQWVTEPQQGIIPDLDALDGDAEESSASSGSSGSKGSGSKGSGKGPSAPMGAGR